MNRTITIEPVTIDTLQNAKEERALTAICAQIDSLCQSALYTRKCIEAAMPEMKSRAIRKALATIDTTLGVQEEDWHQVIADYDLPTFSSLTPANDGRQ